MAHPMGEREAGILRLGFDRRLKLEFHGSKVTSDAGLLPYRELDDAVGLSEIAGEILTDTRRGKNGRHGSCRAVPPVRFRTPWRVRRRERCRPAQPRPGHAVDRRRSCCHETGCLDQSDGALRDGCCPKFWPRRGRTSPRLPIFRGNGSIVCMTGTRRR